MIIKTMKSISFNNTILFLALFVCVCSTHFAQAQTYYPHALQPFTYYIREAPYVDESGKLLLTCAPIPIKDQTTDWDTCSEKFGSCFYSKKDCENPRGWTYVDKTATSPAGCYYFIEYPYVEAEGENIATFHSQKICQDFLNDLIQNKETTALSRDYVSEADPGATLAKVPYTMLNHPKCYWGENAKTLCEQEKGGGGKDQKNIDGCYRGVSINKTNNTCLGLSQWVKDILGAVSIVGGQNTSDIQGKIDFAIDKLGFGPFNQCNIQEKEQEQDKEQENEGEITGSNCHKGAIILENSPSEWVVKTSNSSFASNNKTFASLASAKAAIDASNLSFNDCECYKGITIFKMNKETYAFGDQHAYIDLVEYVRDGSPQGGLAAVKSWIDSEIANHPNDIEQYRSQCAVSGALPQSEADEEAIIHLIPGKTTSDSKGTVIYGRLDNPSNTQKYTVGFIQYPAGYEKEFLEIGYKSIIKGEYSFTIPNLFLEGSGNCLKAFYKDVSGYITSEETRCFERLGQPQSQPGAGSQTKTASGALPQSVVGGEEKVSVSVGSERENSMRFVVADVMGPKPDIVRFEFYRKVEENQPLRLEINLPEGDYKEITESWYRFSPSEDWRELSKDIKDTFKSYANEEICVSAEAIYDGHFDKPIYSDNKICQKYRDIFLAEVDLIGSEAGLEQTYAAYYGDISSQGFVFFRASEAGKAKTIQLQKIGYPEIAYDGSFIRLTPSGSLQEITNLRNEILAKFKAYAKEQICVRAWVKDKGTGRMIYSPSWRCATYSSIQKRAAVAGWKCVDGLCVFVKDGAEYNSLGMCQAYCKSTAGLDQKKTAMR